MKLRIELSLDNDAFAGPDGQEEIARILSELAERLPLPVRMAVGTWRNLYDVNGNLVGHAEVCSD